MWHGGSGAPGGGGKTLTLHPDSEGEQPLRLEALPLPGLAVMGDPGLDDGGAQLAGVSLIEQAQVELDGAGPSGRLSLYASSTQWRTMSESSVVPSASLTSGRVSKGNQARATGGRFSRRLGGVRASAVTSR